MKVRILSGIVQSSNKKLFEANNFSSDNKKGTHTCAVLSKSSIHILNVSSLYKVV